MSDLSIAGATRMLDPWLAGRSIETVELMSGGLLNRNYHLRLRGRPDEVVLRIYDHNPSACAKEVAVLALLGRDIPVPRVFYSEDDPALGPPHAVISVIGGISLHTLRSFGDEDAVADAVYDAGRILARLSSYPGPVTPATTVLDLVRLFTAAPLFVERAGAVVANEVVALAARWQPRLTEAASTIGLVHGDFNARNIFVRQAEDGWRVSGVLDWEFALNATPFCDIGNFLRYHRPDRPRFEPHFSSGLRDGGISLPSDWLSIARLIDLPALCEMLGRFTLPDEFVPELVDLVRQTVTNE